MRVLIACEFSGTVRDAFRALGHDAMSCDLLPTERPGPHYRGDVRDVLDEGWDLMVAHPPCTYLASSGLHWNGRVAGRAKKTTEAVAFVKALYDTPIPRVAIENPIGALSSRFRRPDQIIQPWQFGHDASKATCLWLKGLPLLRPTNVLPGGKEARRANQTPSGQNKLGPSPDRWKLRSVTYPGIAEAFAAQWGALWEPVVSASECRPCEGCGEPYCDRHRDHHAECPCKGPTQDGIAYSPDGRYAREVSA